MIDLDGYAPTISLRPAELRGLEHLPTSSKDALTPVFLLAPWTTARTLRQAVHRIETAFPNRPYFLDIDRHYSVDGKTSNASQEFRSILNPVDAYAEWLNFLGEHPNAKPCLQFVDADLLSVRSQIRNIQAAGRQFGVRVNTNRLPTYFAECVEHLAELGTADYTVLLDAGWTRDALTLSAVFTGLIQRFFGELDGRIPIVVSCTSARRSYSDVQGVEAIRFTNRDLISDIRRNAQRELIVYGDWASVRPREEQGGGATPIPRIDYPLDTSWVFSRNQEDNWEFEDAARALIRSDYWHGNLQIWGEYMIEQTIADPDFGINTPQKNVAARVNIHLHRQAQFGGDLGNIDLVEAWED